MLRIFSKKTAIYECEKEFLTQMKNQYQNVQLFITSNAIDNQSSVEGNWMDATKQTTNKLNKEVKEPVELCFFPNAQYEVTFNSENNFSQGQLAVLSKMPTQQQILNQEPVEIYVAPEGVKSVPNECNSEEGFLILGWRKRRIGLSPERIHYIGEMMQAKRQQYGLKHRIATTIHASMGQDLSNVVTKVSSTDPKFSLWEKEQVVVLLSRTNYCKNIIFIGNKKETSLALSKVLLKNYQYSEFISQIVDNCGIHTNTDIRNFIDLSTQPLRCVDIELPRDQTGYVYILGSLKDREVTYIGTTIDLRKRLNSHNSGYG
jgi:hypothetical protein